MGMPSVHLPELLEEAAELEAEAPGQAHPLHVALFYREVAAVGFLVPVPLLLACLFSFVAMAAEGDDLPPFDVPADEDLGPGEGV
jgi:hypothetical protein